MKNFISLISLFIISMGVHAQSPWYFGSGEAVNLTDAIKYKSGVRQISGPLDPTITAVPGEAGSVYLSTSGNMYLKQDSGLSTNWNLVGAGGGGGGISTINGQSGPSVSIAVGTAGTNANVTATGNTVTVNLPTASATNRGLLSSTDWSDFNSKENGIASGTTSQYFRGDKTWQTLDKASVGLSNVDNTSDLAKPISTATQTALNGKEGTISSGTTSQYFRGDKTWQTLNKAAVGLGNVDNTSDANKPISTATQTALNNKAPSLKNYPKVLPSLDLNFARDQKLDPRITFSRTSSRTCINKFGLVYTLEVNEPCFDHDPATLESKGLLIEESRTNLLTHSNLFENSAWTKSRSSFMSDAIAAPDGALTAGVLIESINTGTHSLGSSFNAVNGTRYSISVFAKKKERTVITINLNDSDFGSGSHATFDLDAGLVIGSATGDGNPTRSIHPYGDGWYRCVLNITAVNTNANSLINISLNNSNVDVPTPSYTGDGTSSLYIWGAQLEVGSFPTSYIPSVETFTSRASTATYIDSTGKIATAAINAPRLSYNPENLNVAPKLLLEPASTNLALWSDDFSNAYWAKSEISVTSNIAVAPNGTMTADKLVESAATSTHSIQTSNINFTIGKVYTWSMFLKASERTRANFWVIGGLVGGDNHQYVDLITGEATTTRPSDISIRTRRYPDGWWKVSLTFVSKSTTGVVGVQPALVTNNYVGDGTSGIYVWGAQLEEGYSSSYIPTTSAPVTRSEDVYTSVASTRAADLASITGANFSSWYNQSEGTFVVKGVIQVPESGSATPTFGMGLYLDGNNRLRLNIDSSNTANRRLFLSGRLNNDTATRVSALRSSLPAGLLEGTYSFGYKSGEYPKGATSSGVFPLATGNVYAPFSPSLYIGASASGSDLQNGTISHLRYYPKRLTDNELQAVSDPEINEFLWAVGR